MRTLLALMPFKAFIMKIDCHIRKQIDRLQQIENNDGFIDVQFEISLRPGKSDRLVIADRLGKRPSASPRIASD